MLTGLREYDGSSDYFNRHPRKKRGLLCSMARFLRFDRRNQESGHPSEVEVRLKKS